MKLAPLLCLLLASCTTYNGTTPGGGSYAATYVGTRATGIDHTPAGFKGDLDNSVAFKDASTTVRAMFQSYLTMAGLKYSLGKYYDQEAKVVSANKAVKIEELRNAKSATEGQNALEALRITTPVAP